MAKAGRATQVGATPSNGSCVAGAIGTTLLSAIAPSISRFAVTLCATTYQASMLMSRVNAAAPTIVPAASLIGDIEIETSIRRPSLAIRCVST